MHYSTRVSTQPPRQFGGSAPQYWTERGLLWMLINGQLPPFASPVAAVDYASLANYLQGDSQWLPPDQYKSAVVTAIDAPMRYFNNGEVQASGGRYGGIGTVWTRRAMVPLAWTLLGDFFLTANLAISPPKPATTSVIPWGVARFQAVSAQGSVTVTPAYLLLSPVPFDGSMTFFSRLANCFF